MWTLFSTLLLLAPQAWAAGEGEAHASPSIFAGDLGNIFWTLVTFGAVVAVLGKFAWPPILSALQKREEFIRDSLAQAKQDREESERLRKEFEEQLHKAREEASAIVEEGRRDAEALHRKLEQQAKTEAGAIVDRARREVELAKDSAIKELYGLAGALATNTAGRIIRKELNADDHARLIDDAIAEIAKADVAGKN